VFYKSSLGVDKKSVDLETICHSGRSETQDIALDGRVVGAETLLGRSMGEHFVKAP
jgi:hypothetical protein